MIDQHFINHYNKNNSDVNLIIDVMCHPKKEDARMFLCMINDVMNYYISRIIFVFITIEQPKLIRNIRV